MDFDPTSVAIKSDVAPHVVDAWVCGSAARNDLDEASDIDITIVVNDEAAIALESSDFVSISEPLPPIDVSSYTFTGFSHLVDPPSLFAWHLRLEGRLLTPPGGKAMELLESLGPFRRHGADLDVLRQVAEEALDALSGESLTRDFELGVLGTVIRNVALLITDIDGAPDFSRHAPARLVHHPVGLPTDLETYYMLSRARKTSAGVLDARPGSTDIETGWVLLDWLTRCEAYISERGML